MRKTRKTNEENMSTKLLKQHLLTILGIIFITASLFLIYPLSFSPISAVLAMSGVTILILQYIIKSEIKTAPLEEKVYILSIAISIFAFALAITLYSFITVEWVPRLITPFSPGSKPVNPIYELTPEIKHPYAEIAWNIAEIGLILFILGIIIKIRTEFF